jgi:hypothetical protein
MRSQKRQFRRRKVITPAWIFDDDGIFVQGNTDNFSPGGLLMTAVAVPGRIEPGKVVKIKIGCPDDTGNSNVLHTVSGVTEVMRLENTNGQRGIALKFISELVLD